MKKLILFLGAILALGLLVRAEAGQSETLSVESNFVKAPFAANALGIGAESPLWIRFFGEQVWKWQEEDFILREGITGLEWTLCDPEIYEQDLCIKDAGSEVQFTFINTKSDITSSLVSYRGVIRNVGGTARQGVQSSNSDFQVLSRVAWGADESWRWAENFGKEVGYSALEGDPEIIRIVNYEAGEGLWWPLEYQKEIDKVVVHHTATSGHLSDPEAALRAIYLYHTQVKKWGDIGYNYVIAPDGRIFEGRKGGADVVGAHAYGFNVGSVGIAVLGDYEANSVPSAVTTSLQKLVASLGSKYGIDLEGEEEFYGRVMPNVLGHRDLNATTCPGTNLYKNVVQMRGGLTYARQAATGKTEDDKGKNQLQNATTTTTTATNPSAETVVAPVYEYEVIAGDEGQSGRVGDKLLITLQLKNEGNVAWGAGTFLKSVKSWDDEYFSLQTTRNRQGKVADMAQKQVAPEAQATFRFMVELQKEGEGVLEVFPVWGEAQSVHPIRIAIDVQK